MTESLINLISQLKKKFSICEASHNMQLLKTVKGILQNAEDIVLLASELQ